LYKYFNTLIYAIDNMSTMTSPKIQMFKRKKSLQFTVEIQVYLHFNFTKLLAELKDKLLDNMHKIHTFFI